MKPIFLAGFVSIALATACEAQALTLTLTPSQLAQEISAQGERAVVQRLDRDGQFDAVLKGIASGNAAWIQLAPRIAKGSDAGDSTGLSIALARALPKNPKAVLRVLDDAPATSVDAVCGVPFIEPTSHEVKTYLSQAIPAVKRVPRSTQFPKRDACLSELSEAGRSSTTQ